MSRILTFCVISLMTLWLSPATAQELWSCQARAVDDSRVLLGWKPVADASAYRVYRTTSVDGNVDASVDFMAAAPDHYLDTGLNENGTYFYRVVAESAAGNVLAVTPEVSATTVADTKPARLLSAHAPSGTSVELMFDEAILLGESAAAQFEILGTQILAATPGELPGQVMLQTSQQPAGVPTVKVRGVLDEGFTPNATTTSARFVTSAALLSSYPLNEGAGVDAFDMTGHGNNGAISGAMWDQETLVFNGVDGLVALPETPIGGRTLTLSAWVRVDSFGNGDGRILSKTMGSAEQDHIWMVGFMPDVLGHRLRFRVRAGGTTSTLAASGALMPAFEWVHVAVTYDGTWMRIYQNGAVVGSMMKNGDLDPGLGVPAALGNQPQMDRPLAGALRDARIYSRALDAEEVMFMAAPTAKPIGDSGAVEFGGSTAIAVLENDDLGTPITGDPWIDIVMPPLHGTVTVDGNGVVHYHHLGTSIAPDRFTYMLRNPTFPSSQKATVTIEVATTPLWSNGLVLHLDAAQGVVADGNSVVSSWNDLSGAGNDLDMVGAPEHVIGVLRGRQVVHFDTGSYAANSGPLAGLPSGGADRTMIAVVHYGSGGDAVSIGTPMCSEALTLGRVEELGALTVGNGCGQLIGAPVQQRGWVVQSVTLEAGQARLYVNGEMLAVAPAALATTMDALTIGMGSNVDVAAVLVYDYPLSEDTHALVYEHLRQFYFLDGDGTPQCETDFVRSPRAGSSPIAVLENDYADLGIDVTSVAIVDAPSFGSATVDPVTGVITYTHAGATLMPDRLTYAVRDMLGVQSYPTEVWIGIDGYDCSLAREGVVLHLDAGRGVQTDASGAVVGWRDSTSLENDLMATGSAQFLPVAANGHAAVALNGASLLRSGGLTGFPVGAADRTLLVVARSNAGVGAVRYGDSACGADFGVQLGSVSVATGCPPVGAVTQGTGFGVFALVLAGGTHTLHADGNLLEAGSMGLQTPGMRFLIDGSGIDVAEVILYDHALTDLERQRAESYLREKYVDGICDPPCLMPRIVADLMDTTVCAGGDLLLEVAATGDSIGYEWYRDGMLVPGANGATLLVNPGTAGDSETYQVRVSSFCGEIWSSIGTVRTLLPVQFVTAPGDHHLCPGDVALLQVQAVGSELTYEWSVDGVLLPGVTGASFEFVATETSPPLSTYSVVVRNGCSHVTVPSFVVCVEQTPVIAQQPTSRSACDGDDLTLTVAVDAPLPVDYQWFRDGVLLPGAVQSELTLTGVTAADSGGYTVTVMNTCGTATSEPALLMVGQAPTFVVAPTASPLWCPGDVIELSGVVSGEGNLYQWLRDDVAVPGATEASLMISPLTPADSGDYVLTVSNDCGAVASPAVAITVREPLAIVEHPIGGSFCAGEGTILTAAATGAVESWQWRHDGVAIPGATAPQLVLGGLQLTDSGAYDVVATGPCGSLTSDAAPIVVFGIPEVLLGLSAVTTCEGFDVELTVLANGSGDLGYQWRRNGVNVAGATEATLVLLAVTAAEAGIYDVVVTSSCGVATVTGAPLTVIPQQQCDCNANGVLDGDDLATGGATDCNNNGVIDSCDIAAGTSVDVDGDGIPDDCTGRFVRGDVNGDDLHSLVDAILLLDFLFSQNSPTPLSCHDAADYNDDGNVNLIDVIANLMYVFSLGGPAPAAPFPACGADPTLDLLGCDRMSCE
ncbi:MAG: LamG-like jellyroll fold domain-containing protein [Planctomycetota bacterium]